MNSNRSGVVCFILGVLMLGSLPACTGMPDGVEPVTGFDKSRYLGLWHEIARLDHSFERDLVDVTADYALREDGAVRVVISRFLSLARSMAVILCLSWTRTINTLLSLATISITCGSWQGSRRSVTKFVVNSSAVPSPLDSQLTSWSGCIDEARLCQQPTGEC